MTQKNKLPKDWKIVELKEVVSLLGDGLHGTPKYTNESDYYFINGNNLGNGKITIKENTKKVSIEEYQKYKKLLNDKTVLVSINGTLGNVAFYNNEKVILGKSACYFNVLDCLDKQYIKILLSGLEFLNYAHKSATGSTIPNVSLKTMREFKFPLPPLETQQAIVSKIEELFSELDKGVEDLKTAQQQLKTYRQSVLKYAFEGKLTNKKVKDGELPKGWNIFKIGEVCKTIDGDRGPNYPKKEEFSKEGYCLYLSTKNVREDRFLFEETIFITKEKDEKLRSGKLQKNDVVITTRGTLGNVALYDNKVPFKHIRINSGMLILRIENENLNNYYLMKFITSPVFINQLKNMQTGTAQPQIPANILREIEIPIPPNLEEQHQIVQEIESRLSVADKMEESIAQSLQQAEALRQSILKKAFSGELV